MSKYQIIRLKDKYLLRKKDGKEWRYYDKNDPSHWWTDWTYNSVTRFDILSDALAELEEVKNPYEVIYPPKKWWQIWRRS